jgi:hypothetical protein
LVEVKQELNTALLKVIEKDGAIGRLSVSDFGSVFIFSADPP